MDKSSWVIFKLNSYLEFNRLMELKITETNNEWLVAKILVTLKLGQYLVVDETKHYRKLVMLCVSWHWCSTNYKWKNIVKKFGQKLGVDFKHFYIFDVKKSS